MATTFAVGFACLGQEHVKSVHTGGLQIHVILVVPRTIVVEGDCKLKGDLQKKFIMLCIGLLGLIAACQMLWLCSDSLAGPA